MMECNSDRTSGSMLALAEVKSSLSSASVVSAIMESSRDVEDGGSSRKSSVVF